jgi:hypothetical protein
MSESKHNKFKRLAKLRGERALNDLRLVANLSNKKNYEYTDDDVKALFSALEEELRVAKLGFIKNKKRGIKL